MFSSGQSPIGLTLLLIALPAAAGATHIIDKLVVGICSDPGVALIDYRSRKRHGGFPI